MIHFFLNAIIYKWEKLQICLLNKNICIVCVGRRCACEGSHVVCGLRIWHTCIREYGTTWVIWVVGNDSTCQYILVTYFFCKQGPAFLNCTPKEGWKLNWPKIMVIRKTTGTMSFIVWMAHRIIILLKIKINSLFQGIHRRITIFNLKISDESKKDRDETRRNKVIKTTKINIIIWIIHSNSEFQNLRGD